MVENECNECGGEIIESTGGFLVCSECGLTRDIILDDQEPSVYNGNGLEVETRQHGGFKTAGIADMALMTYTDSKKAKTPNLRRALRYDAFFGWGVVRIEKVKNTIKKICLKLNLTQEFQGRCYYLLQEIANTEPYERIADTLENVAAAIVYLEARSEQKPVIIKDFEILNFPRTNIFKKFAKWTRKFNIPIGRQKIKPLVWRFINELFEETPKNARNKYLLAKWVLERFPQFQYLGNPIVVLQSLIYLGCKKNKYFKINQQELSNLLGYSERLFRFHLPAIKNVLKNDG